MKKGTRERGRSSCHPTLPTSPLIQTWRYMTDPLPLLDECARTLGEIFRLRVLGIGELVVLSNPAHIRTIFTGPVGLMNTGQITQRFLGSVLGDRSVLMLDGTVHQKRRRLLLPPFGRERMHEYLEGMCEATERSIDGWPMGRPFSIQPEVARIAADVIMLAIFGIDPNKDEHHLVKQIMRFAADAHGSPLVAVRPLQVDLGRYSPWGKVVRIIRETHAALDAEIERRRQTAENSSRKDIFSLLLQAKYEDGEPLHDADIRAELLTFLIGGHETTGTSLARVLEQALSRPAILERIMAELDKVVGKAKLTREHMEKLAYLDAFIKEAMRCRPIAPANSPRLLKASFEIGGYTLREGWAVLSSMDLLGKNPDVYKDPDVFRPERFLGEDAPGAYEWIPFGGGARRCIGMALALYEMKAVLATMLPRVRLRLRNQHTKGVMRGVFVAPEKGLEVELVERQPRSVIAA